jgi:hypothetical protein
VSEDHKLKSVNWTTGMLLTPEHFRRTDAYIDEAIQWQYRYCIPGSGLLGGGLRQDPAERGLGKHDPKIHVEDDGSSVRVSVLQARGITPAGTPIDIDETRSVHAEFRKADLAGATDLLVYVVSTGDKEEDDSTVGVDDANPNQAFLRRPKYEVRLGAEADVVARSIVVAKLRRASETLGFSRDGQFIPSCAALLAHSSLFSGWTTLQAEIMLQAGRYQELHRRVADYADQIARRGIDTRSDQDIRAFVERAVLALETCAYETLDPAMAPLRFFQQVDRAGRLIAVALDLSEATRQFFLSLGEELATYGEMLEAEREALARQRELSPRSDLRDSLDRATATLSRLRQLVEALEGKYIDFRINKSVESLRFLLDRGGEHFYVSVATPSHPQREGDVLTFVFSQMSLTGRHEYRVVLTGDPHGSQHWQVGEELKVDFQINSAAGPCPRISRGIPCEIPGQRNFAVNFDTPPDVATISGLTLTVQPAYRVRGAMLYQRRLGLVPATRAAAPPPMGPSTPVPAEGKPVPAQGPVIKMRPPKPNQPG